MFERYCTETGSRGSMSEVWIDKDAKLVKKFYKIDGVTIRNRAPLHNTIEEITQLFNTEIYWSTKLKSKYVLETYEYGTLDAQNGYYILQEWGGPDLLAYNNVDLPIHFPEILDQLEEMFIFFQEHNVYKLNNAKCNLTGTNGILRCFDFKYAVHRELKYKMAEYRTIHEWLGNIDPSIIPRLAQYI